MHKLTRPQSPSCLDSYRHGRDNWNDVTSEDKRQIWQQLNIMQQARCAYCECSIADGNAHIEHFRQRGRYRQGTFDWHNLFGSCNHENRCGKYKDKQKYEHQVLIKMDVEDPEDLLRFLPDGRVKPKEGLDEASRLRAEATIEIFNLDGELRQVRENFVRGYLQSAEELAQLVDECTPDEWQALLEAELEAVIGMPHETAIRHVLSFA